MSDYVYRAEKRAALLKTRDAQLRFERLFGPPHDYPQKLLETVRKQLSAQRAVYRFECQTRAPKVESEDYVLIRVPTRNALFAEVTRVTDERNVASGVIYFGVDDALGPTNRFSQKLAIPFDKIDAQIDGEWKQLTSKTLARLAT